MNKQLKALAESAFEPINAMASEGIADRHTFEQAWFQEYNQRFAELIVQECVDVVEGGRFLHEQAPTALFAKECSNAIKRHFGVE